MPADSEANTERSQQLQSRAELLLPILLGYSKILGLFLVAAFVIASWTDLRALLPRLSQFKALGVEFKVTELAVDLRKQAESVKAPSVVLQPHDYNAVVARALKVQSVFQGATILWVDNEPANNLPFRRLLRTLGAGVEPARSTEEALALARVANFDLVVSDINRDNDKENGIDGLKQLRAARVTCPAVFYVFHLDPSKPVPGGALGITNRPDELLHLVIDGLERARWSQEPRPGEQPVAAESQSGKAAAEPR